MNKDEEETYIRRMFNSYDDDDNGYLDKQEFVKVVKSMIKDLAEGQTDEEIEKIAIESIDRFDLNQNGKIEYDEFRELVKFLIDEKGLAINN